MPYIKLLNFSKNIARIVFLLFILCSIAYGADEKKINELKEHVIAANQYLKKHGEKQAFAEFSKEKGLFSQGDFYIFVIKYNGVMLAHPYLTVGDSYIDLIDEYGTPVIEMLIAKAKEGGGLMGYFWKVPGTDVVKEKLGYILPVEKGYLIGSGLYEK